MSQDITPTITLGIADKYKTGAVELYEQAFGQKLAVAIRNKEKRLRVLEQGIKLEFAVAAVSGDEIFGIAGFHHAGGALTSGISFHSLRKELGLWRTLWAVLIFSLYERKPLAGELVMDGIAVRADMRGKGLGSALLQRLQEFAASHAYATIRLDVIDTNSGAKKLYEKLGFKTEKKEDYAFLKPILGFAGSTTMIYEVATSKR